MDPQQDILSRNSNVYFVALGNSSSLAAVLFPPGLVLAGAALACSSRFGGWGGLRRGNVGSPSPTRCLGNYLSAGLRRYVAFNEAEAPIPPAGHRVLNKFLGGGPVNRAIPKEHEGLRVWFGVSVKPAAPQKGVA